MNQTTRKMVREGVMVGLLGAGAVALWFLIIDVIRGRPLTTPSILGQVILARNAAPEVNEPVWWAVFAYTGVHVAAFVLFGLLISKLFTLADRNGFVRFAILVVFAAFEVFFVGVVATFFQATAGRFPVWSILAANTIAAVVMGWYLWMRHPVLRQRLRYEPLGT